MIYTLPDTLFEARVQGFPAGLTTVTVGILDDQGGETLAPVAAVENPAGSGSYIAQLTAPAAGDYSLIWQAGDGSQPVFDQLTVNATGAPPAAPAGYTPTIDEVAALVPSRAKGQYGRIATFDASTQPTGDQVQTIVDRQAARFASRYGDPIPDPLNAAARDLIALRAAALVELTFFGDQIKADRSPYAELKALADEAQADFETDRLKLGADLEPGTDDDTSPAGLAVWNPPTCDSPGSFMERVW